MEKQNVAHQNSQLPQDELILVVHVSNLFPAGPWQGLKKDDIHEIVSRIEKFGEFRYRSEMENDVHYKQIIPYLVFKHQHNYFLMERKATATEQRLRSKMTLGIGGHVRQEDMHGATVFEWAWREFHEEIDFKGNVKITTLGLLNDDSNSVGQVHMGLVLLVDGNSDQISVKSELKEGMLMPLEECRMHFEQMEPWSQLVFDVLKQHDNTTK